MGWDSRQRRLATAILPLILLSLAACRSPEPDPAFNGTVLNAAEAAPGFALTNQFNQPVSLEGLSGSIVVLTFLYTNCPNVCPIVTSQLRNVYRDLGADVDSVKFVAVSVDPERDTVEAASRYLARWEMLYQWEYLVGDRASLEPVWKSYYVDPVIDDPGTAGLVSSKRTPEPTGAVEALSAQIADRFLVIHSTPVFLIDTEGIRRVVFTAPLDTDDVVRDIRTLLN